MEVALAICSPRNEGKLQNVGHLLAAGALLSFAGIPALVGVGVGLLCTGVGVAEYGTSIERIAR